MRVAVLSASLALALLGALASPACAQAAGKERAAQAPSAAERELFAVEEAWAKALISRDASVFDRLIAPDWVYSDEQGVTGKRAVIAGYTKGADTVTAAGNEDMRAHVHSNTAVVTGILWTRGHSKGKPFSHRYRYTDTWMRMDGRWRCIGSQDYDLPAPSR